MTTASAISLTHVSFAHIAGELTKRLDAAGERETAALGRELELEFTRWGIVPPSDDMRRRAINALADWQRRAGEFLAARKSGA